MSAIVNEMNPGQYDTEMADLFGTQLVGRLLSMDELDQVGGGDGIGSCGPGGFTYYQTGGGQYYQTGSGSYSQNGGSYTMTC